MLSLSCLHINYIDCTAVLFLAVSKPRNLYSYKISYVQIIKIDLRPDVCCNG